MTTPPGASELPDYETFIGAIQALIEKTDNLTSSAFARPAPDLHEGETITVTTGDGWHLCYEAIVTKIDNFRVTARAEDGGREWQFWLDTQEEGRMAVMPDASFRTAAQVDYDERVADARVVLATHGFDARRDSRPAPNVMLAVSALLCALDRARA